MINHFTFYFYVILLFNFSISQMTEEKRRNLLSNFTKKIDISKYNIISPVNALYIREEMTYDPKRIKEIISSNGFPESYNFIEDKNPPVNIKDQKSCGACWAFAATTALSYRYYLKGINVDLSPQSLLSCYFQDCDAGAFILDSNLFAVKNGMTTESCYPYSSSNGRVTDSCPTKCKNSEQFKKYYAKNTYATDLNNDNDDNYYSVVTIIMDQLVNFGPVASSIVSHKDLYSLVGNKQCKNIIYKYDGTSELTGGHAVTIVGYGHENNKYYWIVQNSWGENFCDGGFAKIEFGQIEIENVAFSEPYIETDSSNDKDISAKLILQDDCRIKYSTKSNGYDESFELNFDNKDKKANSNFYYQCSKDPTTKQNEGICTYAYESLYSEKGYYNYKNSSLLKNINNNKLILDYSSINQNQFYYYGADYIDSIYKETESFYVSQSGSSISLIFSSMSGDTNFVSKIYPNQGTTASFSNCKLTNIEIQNDHYLLYCKLTKNDINNIPQNNNLPLVYDSLCGKKEKTSVMIQKLDTTKYPVYKIKEFILPYDDSIDGDDEITLIAEIEGSVSGLNGKSENNLFSVIININSNNKVSNILMTCGIPNSSSNEKDFEIYCYADLSRRTNYDSIYLTPYYTPAKIITPFEVIIDNNIQGISDGDVYIYNYRSDSLFIHYSFYFVLILLILLI